MSVQVAGLASGLNWQNIINELVAADSAGENQVKAQQTTVNNQVSALGSLGTDLTSLTSAVFALESPTLYNAVTAASTTSGSTWAVDAAAGTPTGSYAVNVQTLASAATLQGAEGVSATLNPTSDVSGLTVASIATAQPVTAGTFTVNGQQIAITTSESLQDVFTAISSATGATVAGSYDPAADKVTLASTGGAIVLGAANDTSNFLSALQLTNNNSPTVTSAASLGALQLSHPIATSGLATALTGQDGSGNGSFTINGVTINYNVNTDSLSTLLGRITNAGTGVTASYDATDNRILLTNTATGDLGVSGSDVSGNLLSALGLSGSGATLARGTNAVFSVNHGPLQSSQSNILNPTQLGVTGLSVTVNTTGTQAVQVAIDSSGLLSAIQTFVNSFNQFQSDTAGDTVIGQSSTGAVTTSILSADHEVGDWSSSLEMTVFGAGSGVSGAIKSLDNLGIDFSGTTGQLTISDSAKLEQAITGNTSAVAAFFQTARTGFGSIVNNAVIDIVGQKTSEVQNLQAESKSLGDQITTMQSQLAAEQAQLEAEFQAMEAMESRYQSELQSLNAISGGSGGSGSSSSTSSLATPANSNVFVNGVSNSASGTSSTSSSS